MQSIKPKPSPSLPMGHHSAVEIPGSPMIRATMKRVVLTNRTVTVPSDTLSPLGLASIPVTPDPNCSSKINNRGKSSSSYNDSLPILSLATKKNGKTSKKNRNSGGKSHSPRLNKFVRRLHDMLVREKHSGIVEWRRGLLVFFSTDAFSKNILPKYFNTRNFKTFRRQLNYYGFVHVRSFSATGNTTTALWINQNLAQDEANDDVSAVLKLRRVEPNEDAKTVEGRRLRKELAIHTVEEDIGLNSRTLQLSQIQSIAVRGEETSDPEPYTTILNPSCGTTSSVQLGAACTATPIPQVDSDSSGATSCSSSSNCDDDSTEQEDTEAPPPVPRTREEIAKTDAAASLLLMLSRS